MARVRNDAAYAARRNAILDTAERLVATKGYESLAITDLMSEAGISKGALYHYFASKRDVLTALLDRRLDRWEARLAPLAEETGPADVRLRDFLRTLGGAKAEDRAFLVDVLRSVYAEENAIVYAAVRIGMAERLLPRVALIIADGQAEGKFHPGDSTATARVVISLLQECTDRIGRMLIDIAGGTGSARAIEVQTAAYVEALHRTLGAAPGRLDFVTTTDLRRWSRAARASGRASRKESIT